MLPLILTLIPPPFKILNHIPPGILIMKPLTQNTQIHGRLLHDGVVIAPPEVGEVLGGGVGEVDEVGGEVGRAGEVGGGDVAVRWGEGGVVGEVRGVQDDGDHLEKCTFI